MGKWIRRLMGIVSLAVCLTGCGSDSGKQSQERKPWQPGDRVELIMATGGVGGAYFPLGGGMAKVWRNQIRGLNVTVQATGGSVANVRLLDKKEADLALIQNDVAEYGRTGKESFAENNERYTKYQAVASLYPEVVQIVVRADGDIHRIEDLRGRKVVVGAAASGTELVCRQILAAYGLSYRDRNDLSPMFLGFAEGATALKEQSADCLVIVSGVPNASLADVQTAAKIRLLPVDAVKLRTLHPFYAAFAVKASAYGGMERDVDAAALRAMLVVRDEIDPGLVYMITKALFEHSRDIGHAKALEFDVKSAAQGVTIPFHPGAARYLKEKGVQID